MYSMMNNGTKFTNFVLGTLKYSGLIGCDSTVILTGSASLECAMSSPDFQRFFNGQSDIDVLIVVYQDISFMDNIFSKDILNSFDEDIVNVLNYSYQYGRKRNAINIKYVKSKTFTEWTSLKEVHFKSYRQYSLSAKKPFMRCYGFDDSITISYKEEPVLDYFVLHYDIRLKEKYYLLDIHSMLLFGTIIFGTNLLEAIENFNFFFRSLLTLPDEKLFNIFKYFLEEKRSIKCPELRKLIEKFTEIDIDKILEILKNKGAICEIKGVVKQEAQLATICWARSNPKAVFDFMNKVSMHITSKKFILIIDDMCPKILYNRTDTAQEEINQRYRSAFTNCTIYFSSEIFRKALSTDFMQKFIDMLKKINLNYYIDFLPEKKRANIQEVKLGELIHTFCELFLLNYSEQVLGVDTMIFGKFSQNIIFMAKQQVFKKSKLSYIIIPRLNEGEMDSVFSVTC